MTIMTKSVSRAERIKKQNQIRRKEDDKLESEDVCMLSE
jgi:enolase